MGASAGQAQRESISIDRKPLANKIILNSQNVNSGGGANVNQANQGITPVGSMPHAHAIYGQ